MASVRHSTCSMLAFLYLHLLTSGHHSVPQTSCNSTSHYVGGGFAFIPSILPSGSSWRLEDEHARLPTGYMLTLATYQLRTSDILDSFHSFCHFGKTSLTTLPHMDILSYLCHLTPNDYSLSVAGNHLWSSTIPRCLRLCSTQLSYYLCLPHS